jgi:hypothetical protein
MDDDDLNGDSYKQHRWELFKSDMEAEAEACSFDLEWIDAPQGSDFVNLRVKLRTL